MARLLVIDDEPNIAFSLEQALAHPDLQLLSASTAQAGVDCVRELRPDLVLLDIRLPDKNGLDTFAEIRRLDPSLPVVMMTAFTRTETAIEAMSRGAFDYLIKPMDLDQLKSVVARGLEVSRLNRVPAVLQHDSPSDTASDDAVDQIVGNSPAMQEIYKTIGRIAAQSGPVLILGESGTGKELVARAIFHYSHRRDKPFLAINCAALPDTLLESELFGHEKGAFTGAHHKRIGKFEQVNGGTIFLDEIGDMSLSTQTKALRLLQEQQFERLGGNVLVKTDVRIIAATNQNLQQLVQEGKFRLDLFYRLNGFTIPLPPLRERLGDVPLLVDHFLARFAREQNRHIRRIADDTLQHLLQHDWPGNVRELRSAIQYALVHAAGDVITSDCLPESVRHAPAPAPAPPTPIDSTDPLTLRIRQLLADGQGDLYRRLQSEVDSLLLKLAWDHTSGNQVHMAELLGLARMTLRTKLRQCGLIPDRPSADPD